jgi:double-stranded uracil-DNA glycosylase
MIERDTQVANNFRTFFQTHMDITHVFFNGTKAETYFMRHVLSGINSNSISFLRLPSTSPAYAGMSFAQKLSAWRIILNPTRSQIYIK